MPESQGKDVELAEMFAEAARILLSEPDVGSTLARICQLAVETVTGCQSAGVSVVRASLVSAWSRSDDLPRIVDEIQSETEEGPCMDALRHRQAFMTGSLSIEPRWPHFARRAHDQTGVESILSLPLSTSEDTLGALNMYSLQPDAFDDQDVALGSVFAAHASVALAGAQRGAQLEAMAATRDLIGMAKGIIMARRKVSEDEAFDILRRASQRTNVKLREVAARVVHPHPPEQPEEQSD